MDIRSPFRHVRTRLYFTSESHIHSLINVLRWAHLCGPEGTIEPIVTPNMDEYFDSIERDYLTHIVIRMYENMDKPIDDEQRFRVEMLFTPGVQCDMYADPPPDNTPPMKQFMAVQHDRADNQEHTLSTFAEACMAVKAFGEKPTPSITPMLSSDNLHHAAAAYGGLLSTCTSANSNVSQLTPALSATSAAPRKSLEVNLAHSKSG
mmetsp:Transcript_15778/g.26618  ORF Transcript_15778/g.26618 Transcript_15778/m.26618 type:complete len:206 (-) Transcript_15778:745-1362(-)|eukprot:CAMPEP_0198223234 /NCGR_PEP_ID=MMETSP1445-20131203/91672_1 /TAXON_ID=36898 /ORGANISM="Pyramimonas sp., Strain CCMP2087" /LENGTH=205 /DNA_ID=CAMNT_0043902017 /DNA_START=66 /DNA_END=683 /DNA_ORIENTATION=-